MKGKKGFVGRSALSNQARLFRESSFNAEMEMQVIKKGNAFSRVKAFVAERRVFLKSEKNLLYIKTLKEASLCLAHCDPWLQEGETMSALLSTETLGPNSRTGT